MEDLPEEGRPRECAELVSDHTYTPLPVRGPLPPAPRVRHAIAPSARPDCARHAAGSAAGRRRSTRSTARSS